MKIFVWLAGQKEPHAQIWHDSPMTGEGKSKIVPLFQQKLTEQEELFSLDELILKFKDKINATD
jgi:hypothetical protein